MDYKKEYETLVAIYNVSVALRIKDAKIIQELKDKLNQPSKITIGSQPLQEFIYDKEYREFYGNPQ